jgi:2-oxoglutarate ferredoxin oxidoreductase subunit delta
MAEKKTLQFDFNPNYCKSCGICYGLCPKQVLGPDEEGRPQVVNREACILCKMCELRCPDFAIRVKGV